MTPLAVFGGAFDPFHLGHLHLATRAAQDFGAQTLVIPNGCPPHRPPPQASWPHRLALCRLALNAAPNIEVSELEPPDAPRYTAHTLATLRQHYPQRALLLIIGADAYAALDHWHSPDSVLDAAHLLLVPRADAPLPPLRWGRPLQNPADLNTGTGGVYIWNCRPPAISASQCRHAIATQQPLNPLLPPAAARYIHDHALYAAHR